MVACDFVVPSGQTTTIDSTVKTAGADKTPNAAEVQPGFPALQGSPGQPAGTLIVRDAELQGHDRVFQESKDEPRPPGEAIVSRGGRVRIFSGKISAGNVQVMPRDPSAGPPPRASYPLAPALSATTNSTIEIMGGTFTSSRLTGSVPILVDAPAIAVSDSQLTITSGTFLLGDNPLRAARQLPVTPSVLAARSRVEISGGSFASGTVQLFSSQTVIRGGSFGRGVSLGLRPPPLGFTPIPNGPPNAPLVPILPAPGCTEIRGGSFPSASSVVGVGVVEAGEVVFIYGSGFNLPYGPVPAPFGTPPAPGESVFANGLTLIPLTGTLLMNSAPATFNLSLQPGAIVVLDPGTGPNPPSCATTRFSEFGPASA
jgi:hypothetical protein